MHDGLILKMEMFQFTDKSLQGELKRSSTNSDTVGSESFSVIKERSGGRFLTVKDSKTGQECAFIATGSTLHGIHKAGIISMDVSEGGLGVSLCKNNELKVWETDTGVVRVRFLLKNYYKYCKRVCHVKMNFTLQRELQGHPIDAYTCRFFPSGIVILSGGR